MSTLSIRLPDSLHEKARELAHNENVSINQFVSVALAEKIAALMTEEYILERGRRADRTAFERALDKAPDVEPEALDRL
jgi:hypothetical protein